MFNKILLCFAFFIGIISSGFSQNNSSEIMARYKVRNGIWLTPAYAKQVNGIALGILGPDAPCDLDMAQVSNGLNIQLIANSLFYGFMPVAILKNARINSYERDTILTAQYDSLMLTGDSVFYRTTHNGLEISGFGTTTARVNGVSVSPWAAAHSQFNGVAINLLWHYTTNLNGVSIALINSNLKTKGIQIGLINKSVKLKGLQLGLWNINKQRGLPIINWNFKE